MKPTDLDYPSIARTTTQYEQLMADQNKAREAAQSESATGATRSLAVCLLIAFAVALAIAWAVAVMP